MRESGEGGYREKAVSPSELEQVCAGMEAVADDLGYVETPVMLSICIAPAEQVVDKYESYKEWHEFGSAEVRASYPKGMLGVDAAVARKQMLLGQGFSGAALLVRWGLIDESIDVINDLILQMDMDPDLPDNRPQLRQLAERLKN